jgi:hypothetical protein
MRTDSRDPQANAFSYLNTRCPRRIGISTLHWLCARLSMYSIVSYGVPLAIR